MRKGNRRQGIFAKPCQRFTLCNSSGPCIFGPNASSAGLFSSREFNFFLNAIEDNFEDEATTERTAHNFAA